jgi:hypothetical protein
VHDISLHLPLTQVSLPHARFAPSLARALPAFRGPCASAPPSPNGHLFTFVSIALPLITPHPRPSAAPPFHPLRPSLHQLILIRSEHLLAHLRSSSSLRVDRAAAHIVARYWCTLAHKSWIRLAASVLFDRCPPYSRPICLCLSASSHSPPLACNLICTAIRFFPSLRRRACSLARALSPEHSNTLPALLPSAVGAGRRC